MDTNRNTGPEPRMFLKTITIIYGALAAGQALFAVMAYSLALKPVMNLKPVNDIYFYLVPVFVIAMGFIGNLLYNKRVGEAANAITLQEKKAGYQAALIIRLAPNEGATLFAVVIFLVGGNLYYLAIAGLNILYFLLLRPTRSKIEEDLNLSYGEKGEL